MSWEPLVGWWIMLTVDMFTVYVFCYWVYLSGDRYSQQRWRLRWERVKDILLWRTDPYDKWKKETWKRK